MSASTDQDRQNAEELQTNTGAFLMRMVDFKIPLIWLLTGFIIAVTLVRPSKKIADVEVSSIKKKLKDKGFAAQVDRTQIKACEELLGIPLDEMIAIVLDAMKHVGDELGL